MTCLCETTNFDCVQGRRCPHRRAGPIRGAHDAADRLAAHRAADEVITRTLHVLAAVLGALVLALALWIAVPWLFGWIIQRAMHDAALAADVMRF